MVRGPSSLLDLRLIEEDSSLHHGIILDEGEFLWSLRYILSRCVKETCPGRRKELDGDGPTLPPGHSKDSRGVHDGTLSTRLVCILSGVVFPQRYPSYFRQDRIKEQRSVFLGELQFCRSLSLCCRRRSAVGPSKAEGTDCGWWMRGGAKEAR